MRIRCHSAPVLAEPRAVQSAHLVDQMRSSSRAHPLQGFGSTRKAASQQLGHSLHVRGIAAYRRLDSDESEWR